MFTGLVTDVGTVAAVEDRGEIRRLRLHTAYDPASLVLGCSIACSGPCLTVVAFGPREGGAWFEVDAAAETLRRTTVGRWRPGERVNLERSLRIGDELGGHIVTGHVDGVGTIVEREAVTTGPWGESTRFTVEAPRAIARFIAEKGSVCLDGISLTVNGVEDARFSVLLIPHTLGHTTWGARQAGDPVNIEVDLMARYAARLAAAAAAGY